jgi:hypothetical protein
MNGPTSFRCQMSAKAGGSSTECTCCVSSNAIVFKGASLKPITISPLLYIDEFGMKNGFAICKDEGILALVTCQEELVDFVGVICLELATTELFLEKSNCTNDLKSNF